MRLLLAFKFLSAVKKYLKNANMYYFLSLLCIFTSGKHSKHSRSNKVLSDEMYMYTILLHTIKPN